ncbi:T9SS type A sorting domain-containing protein [candidate division KSB1 bacterium]|nr:T9SS type A sorting domain-containing protein [candidate division KSB1 bacterium]RQW05477.1 MAG: T9SS C-terminal target domain-containing protein [candidate division KSB1 bacterium]
MTKLRLLGILIIVVSACGVLYTQEVVTDIKPFFSNSLNRNMSIYVHRPVSCTPESPCPILIWLTNNGQYASDWNEFQSTLASLLKKGTIKPMLIAIPYAVVGSSWYSDAHLYVNSSMWGNWSDYLVNDVVEWLEQNYPAAKKSDGSHERGYWLIAGFDMGGSGAARAAFRRPDLFSGFASWAGDLAFEALPLWFDWVQKNETNGFRYSFPMQFLTYMLGQYAAVFSYDPASPWKGQYPLQEGTGAVIDSVYNEWVKYSPSTIAREYFSTSDSAPFTDIYISKCTGGVYWSSAYPAFWPKFTEYFHDSLTVWGVDHTYSNANFSMTSVLTWASNSFAPLITREHDLEICAPEIKIINVTAFSRWRPTAQVRNLGRAVAKEIRAFCSISDETTSLYSAQVDIDSLATLEFADVQFPAEWIPLLHKNYEMLVYTQLPGDENSQNDSVKFVLAATPQIDDFENVLHKWQLQPGWKQTADDYFAGKRCLAFAPPTSGAVDAWIELKAPFDLSAARSAMFTFYTKHSMAADDAGLVEISLDAGVEWHAIGAPCNGEQQEWIKQSCALDDYIGPDFASVRFRLRFVSTSGNADALWLIDNAALEVQSMTGIAEQGEKSPEFCTLDDSYPNPFNSTTTIAYQIQRPAHVTLSIYNAVGQHIVTLVDERQESGEQSIRWHGTDQNGRLVASGLYLYSLQVDDFNQQKKLVLLR